MFDPLPDLASDLEWMLLSGQVARETLAEALIYEYYADVVRFALAWLDDQAAARKAARQVFSKALADIYRYRGDEGIATWLYGIVLDTCRQALEGLNRRRTLLAGIPFVRKNSYLGESTPNTELEAAAWLAIDALPEQERLVLLMHYLLEQEDGQIGKLLNQTAEETTKLLEKVRQKLLTRIWLPFRLADPENRYSWGKRVDQFIRITLNQRWLAIQLSDAELRKITRQVLGHLQRINTRQRIKSLSMELALIGATILLIFSTFWGANRLWPEVAETPALGSPPATVLVTRLVYVTPQPSRKASETVTPPPIDIPTEALYTVQPGDTLPEIAILFGVTLEDLRQFNRLPVGATLQPGQLLINPLQLPQVTPLPVTPVPEVTLPPTLEPSVSAEFILKRFELQPPRSLYSIWFDSLTYDYGPVGYIGPARIRRVQAWLGQVQFLVLAGSQDQVDEVWLYHRGILHNALLAKRQPQFLSVGRAQDIYFDSARLLHLHALLDTIDLSLWQFKTLRVEGREEYATRPTIVLAGFDENNTLLLRFWLDASTGLVLRKQLYSSDGTTILEDAAVQQISYAVDFPQNLFMPALPWRGSYALDYKGEPLGLENRLPFEQTTPSRRYLEYIQPTSPIDLSQSRLTFQYPWKLNTSQSISPIDLFADGYYVGSTYFGDPWTTICDRSPDGLKIAFVSQSAPIPSRLLHWISISQPPGKLDTYFGDNTIQQFAFAPDNIRLAVFGLYDSILQYGYLYILNTEDQIAVQLSQYSDIRSLVWSPDGRYVAFIARYQPGDYEDYIVVVDVETGEETYKASVDFESNATSIWPTVNWGVDFPFEMGGLEQCALPDQVR